MRNPLKWNTILGPLLLILISASALARDIEWSGLYRIEGQVLDNPELKSGAGKKRKEYGVHHLILRPRIVASDGLYIQGQFNVFNKNQNTSWGDQLGTVFGIDDRFNEKEAPSIRASQFNLTLQQEFGSLLVGRAPVQFGLGMTHNSGRELFDHFTNVRDLVGYKISMGHFYFLPMVAKVVEGDIGGYDDADDLLLQLQYDNPDNKTKMGVMYWNRKGESGSNYAGTFDNTTDPADIYNPGAAGYTSDDNFNYKLTSFFFAREWASLKLGTEVANQSGDTGVRNSGGRGITFSGFGVATELDYSPLEKKWALGLKAGFATGDDASTDDEFEGFLFNQNYDVAMMLFNHALGQSNVLHTQMNGTAYGPGSRRSPINDPDIESISNVTYLAPYYIYKFSDRWSFKALLATGWVDQTKLYNSTQDADNNLGYEFNFSLNFSPSSRIVWQNTVGWLSPGKAFEGANQFSTSTLYGVMSRAAISF